MFEQAGLNVTHTEKIVKRHDFISWAERQGCPPKVVTQLAQMLVDAPAIAADWLDAQNLGTTEASFVNHHILIKGEKP